MRKFVSVCVSAFVCVYVYMLVSSLCPNGWTDYSEICYEDCERLGLTHRLLLSDCLKWL